MDPCNRDCFNCPFPDCILTTYDDKRKDSARAYYLKNKVTINARSSAYYMANKERVRENRKKWVEKNRKKINKYYRDYYRKNQERILAKRRAAYAAKKALKNK